MIFKKEPGSTDNHSMVAEREIASNSKVVANGRNCEFPANWTFNE